MTTMNPSSERFRFMVPIGDWSGDGHEKCVEVCASAAKPIEAVREAFFSAQAKLPDLDPTKFCHEYENDEVPAKVREVLEQNFPDIDPEGFSTDEMAAYVVWFLNQGDPDLDARIDEEAGVPSLVFYGYDSKNRHIGGFGYGLMRL